MVRVVAWFNKVTLNTSLYFKSRTKQY